MDTEFDARRKNGLAPFDGQTVTLQNYLPLSFFQPAMAAVVEHLYSYRPEATLFRLLDWHNHDGYITEAEPSSWQELRSLVGSEQALKTRFDRCDTDVYEGFFPLERDYYLRLYVPYKWDMPYNAPPSAEQTLWGTFDVTGPESLASQLLQTLHIASVSTARVLPAQTF